MAYRGRLIFPFLIEIAPIDIAASAASSGYDPDFRERVVQATGDRIGDSRRVEGALYKIPGQFYSTDSFRRISMAGTGNLDNSGFTVLVHFKDLEAQGLIDTSTQTSLLKVGDRLNAVYRMDGVLVQTVPASGVFITEAQPIFGLNGFRNLLECTFKSRDAGLG
jgi:hypothetical protein